MAPAGTKENPGHVGACRGRKRNSNVMNVQTPASAVKRELREDTSGERDLILSSLRVAATRSRLITNILDNVGVALRQKQIDCAGALAWLNDEGLLDHLPFGPGAAR
jgi:hypothetical protein